MHGGGIRGIAHAGVIKVLEEENIKIDVMAGTSAGSMITVLYAMGYKPDEILNLFKKYSEELVKINKFTIAKEIKHLVLKKKLSLSGLKSGEDLQNIYNKIAEENRIEKLDDIKMPIMLPAVDISTSKKVNFCSKRVDKKDYISNISVGEAVRASSSFPGIYKPFEYNNYLFLDGGILENVPAKGVKELRSR